MTDLQQRIQVAQTLIEKLNGYRVAGVVVNNPNEAFGRTLDPKEREAYYAALELLRNFIVGETVNEPTVEEKVL